MIRRCPIKSGSGSKWSVEAALRSGWRELILETLNGTDLVFPGICKARKRHRVHLQSMPSSSFLPLTSHKQTWLLLHPFGMLLLPSCPGKIAAGGGGLASQREFTPLYALGWREGVSFSSIFLMEGLMVRLLLVFTTNSYGVCGIAVFPSIEFGRENSSPTG